MLELEGGSAGNLALLESDEPAAQLAVIELSRGILESNWTVSNPSAAPLFSRDAMVARLERIKGSRSRIAALGARYLLGEVAEVPICGDPDCHVHGRGAKPPRESN